MDFMPSDDEVITRNINKIWGVRLPEPLVDLQRTTPCSWKISPYPWWSGGGGEIMDK